MKGGALGAEALDFPMWDGSRFAVAHSPRRVQQHLRHRNMITTLGRSENSPYFGIADPRSNEVCE
ncbi:MAG: hypothetical protein EDM74_02400 [Armatimonadetes bacterium]|nr:MAG: hypothetical protein EDM74_02400 [Armatimonadota bacterium]